MGIDLVVGCASHGVFDTWESCCVSAFCLHYRERLSSYGQQHAHSTQHTAHDPLVMLHTPKIVQLSYCQCSKFVLF